LARKVKGVGTQYPGILKTREKKKLKNGGKM